MSDLAARVSEDMKTAMKAKDAVRLGVLRAVKTAMTNASIEKGHLTAVLEPAEVLAVFRKQIKQRIDSYEQFTNAGREELAAKEKAEIAILEEYLPTPLTEDEIVALVEAAIAETGATSKAEMGKVMKLVQERADGRADGKTISQAVAKRLS